MNDTYQDWLKAFAQAGSHVVVDKSIGSVIYLGDTFDAESMYPKEIKVAQETIEMIKSDGRKVYGILGNHDKGQSDLGTITSWLDVVGITPLTQEGAEIEGCWVMGLNHQNKNLLRETLEGLKKPVTKKPAVLCLHQSLRELCALNGGWEVEAAQVPEWVSRIFLGDLHNHCSYKDKLGREFMYPGAIETVSFNQETEPGFVVYDTGKDTYRHISTQQRAYLKFNLDKLGDHWLEEMSSQINAAELKFGCKPVVQLISTDPVGTEVMDFAESKTLKVVTLEFGRSVSVNGVQAEVPQSESEVKTLARSFLPQTPLGGLAKALLESPNISAVHDWQKTQYPKISTLKQALNQAKEKSC